MPSANVLVALACLGQSCRPIGAERAYPASLPLHPIWKLSRRVMYGLLAAVVGQTKDTADWLWKHTWAQAVAAIPNPLAWPVVAFPPEVPADAVFPPDRKILLAAGRLDSQKGFSLLIDAFAEAGRARPDWSLVILGEGPLREDLQRQIEVASIADRVVMPGYVGNVADWYRRASIFVLSSRFEGFPNVLLEAMAFGLPAVSFDCKSGPSDIIRPGVDGLLVKTGDAAALANAMARLMDDGVLRMQMASEAVAVRERFSEQAVMTQWNRLIAEICRRSDP